MISHPTKLVIALGVAGLAVLGGAWIWSRPELPPPVPDAPPEYVVVPAAPARDALPAWQAAAKFLRLPPREDKGALWLALAEAKALPAAGAALAASNQPALDALHEANRRPELQLLPPGHDVKTPMPSFVGLQDLARVGAADVRRRLAAGDHAGAFGRAADVLALGRRLRHAPPLGVMFPLVGVVIEDQVLAAFRQDAAKVLAAPTSALAAFARDLEALDRIEQPLEASMIGERDLLLRTLRKGLDMNDRIDRETAKTFGVSRFADVTIAVVKNRFDRQIALMRAGDHGGVRAEAREAREAGQDDTFKLALGRVLHRDATLGVVMASVSVPSFAGYGEKAAIAEGRADALRVWLAAERYRRDQGRPPASLAALVPRWLRAAPPDPFAPARPMGYRAGTLWSVALDRRDDGGSPALPLVPASGERVDGARRQGAGDFVFLTPAGPR